MTTVFRVIVPLSKPGIVAGVCWCSFRAWGLSDTGPAGRRANRDGGEPGAESVHDGARLAVRIGNLDGVDGDVTLLLVLFLRKESESLV